MQLLQGQVGACTCGEVWMPLLLLDIFETAPLRRDMHLLQWQLVVCGAAPNGHCRTRAKVLNPLLLVTALKLAAGGGIKQAIVKFRGLRSTE